MTRRLVLSYLAITAFVLLVLELPLAITFADRERKELSADVERDARVLATFAEDVLEGTVDTDVQPLADEYRQRTGGRVVVVDTDGISIADSDSPGGPPRDFSTRPEIIEALAGAESSGVRFSETLGEELLYVAVPVASGGRVLGAVRITYPTAELDERIRHNWIALAFIAGVVLVATAGVGVLLARSVTRPLRSVADAARALSEGDLSARARTDVGPPEVRALARQFDDMAERLQALVDVQRAFVADASHELRTPLTALRLRLDDLEAAAPPDVAAEAAAASAEVARLSRLVDALLALARGEGARPELERVDVDAVARGRVDIWRALAEEQGVAIVLEGAPGATAHAAPGAVEQALDNFLANALDVAPAGSAITVRTVRSNGAVELHVVDHGPGLDEEARARAFDRFWRAPGARASSGGSGLGLAIVDQLARASGGRARLDEAPGGGIDAVLVLPAAPPGGPAGPGAGARAAAVSRR